MLTEAAAKSLRTLIEYLETDESKHYQIADDKENHMYNHVRNVKQWMIDEGYLSKNAMNKYRAYVREMRWGYVDIEAENDDEAREKAQYDGDEFWNKSERIIEKIEKK